jgi:hypothetical protein
MQDRAFLCTYFALLGSLLFYFYLQKQQATSNDALTNRPARIDPVTGRPLVSVCLNQVVQRHRLVAVTLLSSDSEHYAESAVKLVRSMRANSKVAFDAIAFEIKRKPHSDRTRERLTRAGWSICQVERIPHRPGTSINSRWRDCYTKLYIWSMVEYEAAVYIDADCFVINNIDYLFAEAPRHLNHPGMYGIEAGREIFGGEWKDTFNAGVFVIRPDAEEFERILLLKNRRQYKFDVRMAEMGLINEVFKERWFEMPFEYSGNTAIFSERMAEWAERDRKANISVIHFTMEKPWQCGKYKNGVYNRYCDMWRQFE